MSENVELELVKQLKEKRALYEELDEKTKAAKAEYERVYKELHFYLISAQKDATSEYKGLGKVRVSESEIIASVNKDHEEELHKYLYDIGREDIIRPSIPWKSLSSLVKELRENGEEVPEYINVYEKPKLKMFFKKGE